MQLICKKCLIVCSSFWRGRGSVDSGVCLCEEGEVGWEEEETEVGQVTQRRYSVFQWQPGPSPPRTSSAVWLPLASLHKALECVFPPWDEPWSESWLWDLHSGCTALTWLKGSSQGKWRVIDEEPLCPLPPAFASSPFPFPNQTFPTFLFVFTYRVWFVASIWLWIVTSCQGVFLLSCFSGVI